MILPFREKRTATTQRAQEAQREELEAEERRLEQIGAQLEREGEALSGSIDAEVFHAHIERRRAYYQALNRYLHRLWQIRGRFGLPDRDNQQCP